MMMGQIEEKVLEGKMDRDDHDAERLLEERLRPIDTSSTSTTSTLTITATASSPTGTVPNGTPKLATQQSSSPTSSSSDQSSPPVGPPSLLAISTSSVSSIDVLPSTLPALITNASEYKVASSPTSYNPKITLLRDQLILVSIRNH
jgi:hypothetical protein